MAASDSAGGSVPVTYMFAGLVVLALIGLGVLRHFKGTISIS